MHASTMAAVFYDVLELLLEQVAGGAVRISQAAVGMASGIQLDGLCIASDRLLDTFIIEALVASASGCDSQSNALLSMKIGAPPM